MNNFFMITVIEHINISAKKIQLPKTTLPKLSKTDMIKKNSRKNSINPDTNYNSIENMIK